MPRRRNTRKAVRIQKPVVIIYNKNLTWTTFYDNNGVDEQGLNTQIPLNKTLPAAASVYGNDYNAPATVHSTKLEVRWAAGIVNPPVAVQLVWIFPNELRTVRYPGPVRRLKHAQFITLNAVAPRIVRNYLVADPSAETALKFEILIFGMDLDGTKMPPMIFTTNLNQAPVQLIAHSGK